MTDSPTPRTDETVLRVEDVAVQFGGIRALDGVSFGIGPGERVGVVGPNGSGKTTLLNCISGSNRPFDGSVWINGVSTERRTPDAISRSGLARTFQAPRIFPDLTLIENLAFVALQRHRAGILSTVLRTPRTRAARTAALEQSAEVIHFLGLEDKTQLAAGALSYGQRKLLAIGLGLMTDPQILCLDEPLAGVNPSMVRTIEDLLLELNGKGLTLLIIEHNMEFIARFVERTIVMVQGSVLADGPTGDVTNREDVIAALMGQEMHR